MRFFKTAVSLALAAFAAVASAQASTKGNAITEPTVGSVFNAGDSVDIKWMNTVGDRVTIIVMDGAASSLRPVATIATNVVNNGAFTWEVPDDLPRSGTYTIRISYDSNPANYNYSDRFTVLSDVVAPSTSGTTSAPASTTSAPSTTETEAESTTTEAESTSTETDSESTTSAPSTTMRSSTSSRRTTSEPTSQPTDGAPPSAGSATLSSPLAVIMAVLAAALFIH